MFGNWGSHLHYSRGANEMRSAAYHDGLPISTLVPRQHLIHSFPQGLEVFEKTGSIGIDHEQALSPAVQHAVADCPAFALVLHQSNDADVNCTLLSHLLDVSCGHLESGVRGPVS